MEGNYEVFLEGVLCGKVQVTALGLYSRFDCRCKIAGDGIYRLVVKWKKGWENLGIPVPEGDGFRLEKKLSRKHLGEGTPEFFLMAAGQDIESILFPKEPEIPLPQEEPVPQPDTPEEPEVQEDPQPPEKTPPAPEPEAEAPAAPEGEFHPIDPEKPFDSIEALEEAVFAIVDGQPGIVTEPQSSRESPTGQWSEPSTEE